MKKVLFTVSLISLAIGQALAADTLMQSLSEGKASLTLRTRFEQVNDDTPNLDTAKLLSNRLTLGYKTGVFHDVSAYVEFEDVHALGQEEYNSGLNGKTTFAKILDPALTQVNQYYLTGYGAKYGRQKIVLNNARFIGDVGWRQNDQTFDALTYENATLIPKTTLQAGYVFGIDPAATGTDRDLKLAYLNAKVSPVKGHNIAAFYIANEEVTAPASSAKHQGLRADGAFGMFLYEVSMAQQDAYKDGTVADADYSDLQLGLKFPVLTVKLQQEVLEPGFATPLATLHAFNGWADRLTTTPTNGLVDTALWLKAPVLGTELTLACHDFQSDKGSTDYGVEHDLLVSKKFTDKISGLIKYSLYKGDSEAPTTSLKSDAKKLWLQVEVKL